MGRSRLGLRSRSSAFSAVVLSAAILIATFACSLHSAPESTPSAIDNSITLGNMVAMYRDHGLLPPVVPMVAGDSHGAYFSKLATVAAGHMIRIVVLDLQLVFPDQPGVWGYYNRASAPSTNTILLSIHLSPNAAVSTLAHELGHHFQPAALIGTNGGQVFAESVAFLVCRGIGLDTFRSSATYLAQYPEHHGVFQQYAREIDRVVRLMLQELGAIP